MGYMRYCCNGSKSAFQAEGEGSTPLYRSKARLDAKSCVLRGVGSFWAFRGNQASSGRHRRAGRGSTINVPIVRVKIKHHIFHGSVKAGPINTEALGSGHPASFGNWTTREFESHRLDQSVKQPDENLAISRLRNRL